MKIVKFEYFNEKELLNRIRRVHIKGRPDLELYKNSEITLMRNADTNGIHFAQYYVLEKDLNEITACREALLVYGVDIFKLKGFVRVHSINDKLHHQVFDVLPPVVEISPEDGGIPLLCDGMHRIYLAHEAGVSVNCVWIDKVHPDFPYYANPNEEGWNNVKRVEEVPDVKKNYRIVEYKKLFRDFNTQFLNVTQPRTDKKLKKLKVQGKSVAV